MSKFDLAIEDLRVSAFFYEKITGKSPAQQNAAIAVLEAAEKVSEYERGYLIFEAEGELSWREAFLKVAQLSAFRAATEAEMTAYEKLRAIIEAIPEEE